MSSVMIHHFRKWIIPVGLLLAVLFGGLLFVCYDGGKPVISLVEGEKIRLAELSLRNGQMEVRSINGSESHQPVSTQRSFLLTYAGPLKITQKISHAGRQYTGVLREEVKTPGYVLKLTPGDEVCYELMATPVWEVVSGNSFFRHITVQKKYLKISLRQEYPQKQEPVGKNSGEISSGKK